MAKISLNSVLNSQISIATLLVSKLLDLYKENGISDDSLEYSRACYIFHCLEEAESTSGNLPEFHFLK